MRASRASKNEVVDLKNLRMGGSSSPLNLQRVEYCLLARVAVPSPVPWWPPVRGTIRVGGLGTLPGGLDRQKPPNPPPPARKGGGVLAPLAHKLKRM